jgi:hypothetical protein
MVSGQPTKPPHKESKAQAWIPSTNFNKLLTLHLNKQGGISDINDDSQDSRFEVLSVIKINQHLGIPA